mgnify:CR=1 FL=1
MAQVKKSRYYAGKQYKIFQNRKGHKIIQAWTNVDEVGAVYGLFKNEKVAKASCDSFSREVPCRVLIEVPESLKFKLR